MKSTKKLLSLLLVLAMVFSLAIPAFADSEASDPVTATKVSSIADGDQIVIYNTYTYKNTTYQLVMTDTSYTYTNKDTGVSKDELKSAKVTLDGDKMTVPENAAILTVSVDKDGKYSFVNEDGKYLFTDGTHVRFVDEAGANTLFQLKDGKYLVADSAKYNGNAQYIQCYSTYFTVFGYKAANDDNFVMSFFKLDAKETPVDPDPVVKELDGKTVILHTNDIHGKIGGSNGEGSLMAYAYIAAIKADYEAKGAEVILVDAGDYSQGSVYVSLSKGASAIELMNAVGYDIAGLGNHEFDYGYAQLKDNMSKAEFDVLCANVVDENGKTIFDANIIKEVDGVKIGFFALETPETQTKANPALIKGLTFYAEDEMYECAAKQVADLKAKGADIVVCMAHLGVDAESEPNRSYDLYANVKGIDFIIDAHSHTVMEKGDNGEPIQSTGTALANIGVIVIDNATKKIESNKLVKVSDVDKNYDLVISEGLVADATVEAAVKAIMDPIDVEYGKTFAESKVELNGAKSPNGNRDSETNLGDLITDAMIWGINRENTDGTLVSVPEENIVAITNGGGIRAWIHKGDVTKKDVLTVLPFGNTLAVVYVKGSELLEALEASTYCTPTAVGGFPQVAGLKFTVVTSATFVDNGLYPGSTYYAPASINRVTIDEVNGKAFDPNATYAVVTNNFTAAGGDTYYAFARSTAFFDTGLTLDEIVMDYISDELKGVIGEEYAEPAGRITIKEFTDLDSAAWAKDEILEAYNAGIINGMGDGTFLPNESITRAQFVTIIWNYCGNEKSETELTFTDAASIQEWYVDAVKWAVEKGIIKGYEDNTFRPDAEISREEMATIAYRLMQLKGFEAGKDDAAAYDFTDVASVQSWAADAVNVMANNKLITGYKADDGSFYFAPQGHATRAEATVIVMRIVDFLAAPEA